MAAKQSIKLGKIIDNFEQSAPGSVLTAQILAGGTGLNVQAASVVVICEPQLKPSIENQAISRAYRMGQPRNVLVYRLLADETIDERISDLLEEKQQHFNAFADESVLGKESIQIDDTNGFIGIHIHQNVVDLGIIMRHSQGKFFILQLFNDGHCQFTSC